MDKRLATILLIVFVQMVGSGMILPLLPIFAQDEFDMSPTAISLLVSVFFVAQFVAGPILGRWSDRVGRVPILIVSQIGTVLAFLAFGLAGAAWVLFAARIFDGLTGGNLVVAQAYITDITPPERRAQALGLIGAMFSLGFVVGPVVGGILVGVGGGPTLPYFVAATAAVVVVLLTVFPLDESHTQEDRNDIKNNGVGMSLRTALGKGALDVRPFDRLQGAVLPRFAHGDVRALWSSRAVRYERGARRWDPVGRPRPLSDPHPVAVLPRFVRYFGEARLVTIGIVIRAVGLGVYAMVVSPWQAAVGCIFFAPGGGLTMPAVQSLATRTAPDAVRGGVLGLVNASQSLSIIISTAIGGSSSQWVRTFRTSGRSGLLLDRSSRRSRFRA
jgi:DHA1 family tetracycline resistance protein-like MFS transporter